MFNLDQLTRISRPYQPDPKSERFQNLSRRGDDNIALCDLLDSLEVGESVLHPIAFARAKVIMKTFKRMSRKVIRMRQMGVAEGFVRFTRKE